MSHDRKFKIVIKDWCKGCGICMRFCPEHVIELGRGNRAAALRPNKCNRCGMCERRCPDLAIEILSEE